MSIVGKLYRVMDNSYCVNLTKGQYERICFRFVSRTTRIVPLVKIISEPFTNTVVGSNGKRYTTQMIIVRYRKDTYAVFYVSAWVIQPKKMKLKRIIHTHG